MASPPPAKKPRFAESSSQLVSKIVEDAIPKSTKVSTSFWVTVFKNFCQEKSFSIDLGTCSAVELNDVLGRFYVSLRTKQGAVYKRSSYLAARAAIGRYVTKDLNRNFNVFQTPELQGSNRVLDGVLKKNKNEGAERQVDHKEAIRNEDLARLDEYFSDVLTCGDAVKLSQYCWLQLTLHFALRGSEVQIQLTKKDVEFRNDAAQAVLTTGLFFPCYAFLCIAGLALFLKRIIYWSC